MKKISNTKVLLETWPEYLDPFFKNTDVVTHFSCACGWTGKARNKTEAQEMHDTSCACSKTVVEEK